MDVQNPLQIRGLSVRHGKTQLLSNINLDVHAGEFVSLMGENGAGKTTLLHAILGYERIDTGQILLWGEKLGDADPVRLYSRTAFVTSSPEIYPTGATIGDLIRSLPLLYPKWNQALARSLLEGFKLRESQALNRMSLGEGTKVRLLKALSIEPELLLLDELTANLSPDSKNVVTSVLIDLFARKMMAVLYICHSADEALSLSDRVLSLDQTGICERSH